MSEVLDSLGGICPDTDDALMASVGRLFEKRYRWVSRTRPPHMVWFGLLRRPRWPSVCWGKRFPVRHVLVYSGWSVTFLWFEAWGYWLDVAATWEQGSRTA